MCPMGRMKNQSPKYNVCKETTLIITRSSHAPRPDYAHPIYNCCYYLFFIFNSYCVIFKSEFITHSCTYIYAYTNIAYSERKTRIGIFSHLTISLVLFGGECYDV